MFIWQVRSRLFFFKFLNKSAARHSSDRLRTKMSLNLYHDQLECNLYASSYERILLKEYCSGRKTLIEIAGKVLTVLEEMIKLAK